MASQHERQTGIIITGKTGSGKSSVGNALLQKPVFETGCLSSSITKKCVCRTARILDRRITVTDTPGLCDTNDDVDMKAEMENCIRLSLPGPHVFLHVISIGRFTQEDLNSIKTFKTKFGKDVNKYYLLILTRYDDYKRDNDVDILDFESFKDNLTSEWRTLLNQTFEDRICPFDNTLSGKASLEQVTMLLKKIDDIISVNDGNIYTNADFNRAKQLIKKEQQRELDDQDRVQKAKKARIILEVEKANKKLQNTLAEQHAKDELEKQALQEKTKREREQKKEELVRAEEQQKYEIQLQEQRRRENIKQNILCFLDIVEFGCNMYMQYILRK